MQTIDFKIGRRINRDTNPTAHATASVIIHQENSRSSDSNKDDSTIPSFPTVTPQTVFSPDDLYDFVPEIFYRELAKITTAILKDNNSTLLINVIDPSGKIILKAEDLIHLIAILTKVSEDKIIITYKNADIEAGCCGNAIDKISPVKTIKGITINNNDFQFAFNKEFNLMKNNFSISLSLCQIKELNERFAPGGGTAEIIYG
jgi:hypothetical protein